MRSEGLGRRGGVGVRTTCGLLLLLLDRLGQL